METTILCLTRGGIDSYSNQDQAIALAKERATGLLFLYVSNVQFLGLTASPVLVDIETELDEMGDFMLAMAKERAEKAGVQAMTTVRRGVFRQVIKDILKEYPIQTVVMGRPSPETGITTTEYINELIQEIGRESGVEFIVVHQGEIVNHFNHEES
jgi:nucleotide-binding universal stress UspA family protein